VARLKGKIKLENKEQDNRDRRKYGGEKFKHEERKKSEGKEEWKAV
jgi:hypothetical protein